MTLRSRRLFSSILIAASASALLACGGASNDVDLGEDSGIPPTDACAPKACPGGEAWSAATCSCHATGNVTSEGGADAMASQDASPSNENGEDADLTNEDAGSGNGSDGAPSEGGPLGTSIVDASGSDGQPISSQGDDEDGGYESYEDAGYTDGGIIIVDNDGGYCFYFPGYNPCGPGSVFSSDCVCITCPNTCPAGQTPGPNCNGCTSCTTTCPVGFDYGATCSCVPHGVDGGATTPPDAQTSSPPDASANDAESVPETGATEPDASAVQPDAQGGLPDAQGGLPDAQGGGLPDGQVTPPGDGGAPGCLLEGYDNCALGSWCQLGTCPDETTQYGCYCGEDGQATCGLSCPTPPSCAIPNQAACPYGQECVYGSCSGAGASSDVLVCSCYSGGDAYCYTESCSADGGLPYFLGDGGAPPSADAGPSCLLEGRTSCPVGSWCALGTCPDGTTQYGCLCNADGTTTCDLVCPAPPPCEIPGEGTCPVNSSCVFGCGGDSSVGLSCYCWQGGASCDTVSCSETEDAGGPTFPFLP